MFPSRAEEEGGESSPSRCSGSTQRLGESRSKLAEALGKYGIRGSWGMSGSLRQAADSPWLLWSNRTPCLFDRLKLGVIWEEVGEVGSRCLSLAMLRQEMTLSLEPLDWSDYLTSFAITALIFPSTTAALNLPCASRIRRPRRPASSDLAVDLVSGSEVGHQDRTTDGMSKSILAN